MIYLKVTEARNRRRELTLSPLAPNPGVSVRGTSPRADASQTREPDFRSVAPVPLSLLGRGLRSPGKLLEEAPLTGGWELIAWLLTALPEAGRKGQESCPLPSVCLHMPWPRLGWDKIRTLCSLKKKPGPGGLVTSRLRQRPQGGRGV